MTSVDDRVQHELWRGYIPVEIHLARDEVASVTSPAPFFGLVPRGAYLPSWCDAMAGGKYKCDPHSHFSESIANLPIEQLDTNDSSSSKVTPQPWFDFEGMPLRWQLPVGVLFDVLSKKSNELPFKVTVHYSGGIASDAENTCDDTFSDDGLYVSPDTSTVRGYFFNTLKEACYIRTGSASSVMSMTRQAQEDLWRSVSTGDRSLADKAYEQLGRGEGPEEDTDTIRYPVRVYVRMCSSNLDVTSWRDIHWTSAPIEARVVDETNNEKVSRQSTVRDALRMVVGDVERRKWQCTVQGIELDMDTPLVEIHGKLRSADRFMHISFAWIE